MIKRTMILTLFIVLAIAGCGSHHQAGNPSPQPTPTPTPTPTVQHAQVSHGTIPGTHIHDFKRTTTSSLKMMWDGLFPVVYAQSNVTVQVSQNWEGICNNSPLPGTGQAFVSYLVFGIGQNTKSSCSDSFFDTDGTVAAQNALDGKLVFGAGTLSNLVVSTDRGTNIQSAGVPVKIWVKRDNVIQFTGLTCTLPSGAGELICQGTGTFAAQNLDRVIATATKGDTDTIIGLSVNFTKSIQ
jgi:hypothetical protein